MKKLFVLLGLLVLFLLVWWLFLPEPRHNILFTAVTPQQSKVYFKNQVFDTEKNNTLLYSNYYGGGGVAIGDIDNDGLADIYFTGNLVGDKLYLNQGGLEFEDITNTAGIIDDKGWSSGVLMGDINRDGYTDIYVTREMYGDQPGLMKNKLYLNNKNKTFSEVSEKWGVANSQRSRGGTFLDYDNDGDLDLYLLNHPPNPGPLMDMEDSELLLEQYSAVLYKNTGSAFVDVTRDSGLLNTGFPNSVVAADFNSDGLTDLYVTHDFALPDCIYMNNGDGTFTNEVNNMTGHISFSSMGVDAADFNNDGLLDIFVSDMAAEDNYRIKANMGGMEPQAFWNVVNKGHHYQYMYNTLQLNTGFKTFSDVAQIAGLASTDWSWSSLFADFDNDGLKDIFVANGVLKDIRNTDALTKLSQYIDEKGIGKNDGENIDNASIPSDDLERMLALFPSEKLSNYIYRNNGDFTFTRKMDEWGITNKSFSNGTAYGDLDNDGDLDLVINNINDFADIFENHSADNGAHFLRIKPTNKVNGNTISGTKLWLYTEEGVQFSEITGTRGMYSSSEQLAHFGLGKNSSVEKLRVQWPDGKEHIIRNPEIDQLLEIDYGNAGVPTANFTNPEPYYSNITSSMGTGIVHTENDFDDYQLQVLLPHKLSTYGPGIATGDINGDGNEDFFLSGAAGFPGQLILQTDDGQFIPAASSIFLTDKDNEDMGAAFFDADGDKDLDLYVVSGGNEFPIGSEKYQDRLYINDGNGSFVKDREALPDLKISGSKVYPEDFDNDGDLDLFIAGHHIPGRYPAPASSKLLMNQGGRFTDVTGDMAGDLIDLGMVNDAAWFDFDNDNRKDLILAGEWMPVTLLRNGEAGFENISTQAGLNETNGWWFSIVTGDVDGDGDEDLIAGNLGLNYKYKASPEEPFSIYYYDFDLSGSNDVVLAYYNFGGVFPLRGRSCSSQQVPALKEKFGTYDLFAQSDIKSVYGEENLENALHYESTTFASTYFENDGRGQFKAHKLPMEAQFSSINDILISDANHDQVPDIIVAGNLYHAEIETPRNDAGYSLLLQGDGKGGFTPVIPKESGLFLPYDVKSLALISGRSGAYLLAGCNNENIQILKVNNTSFISENLE